MEPNEVIEVYQEQLGGANKSMFLDSHRNGVLEKIESFEEYITLDLENYEEFFVQAAKNDANKSPNYILVDNGLIYYIKLIKAIGILKDCLEDVLEDIVSKFYDSLTTSNPSNSKNILEKFEIMNTIIENFKKYVEQRYDAI